MAQRASHNCAGVLLFGLSLAVISYFVNGRVGAWIGNTAGLVILLWAAAPLAGRLGKKLLGTNAKD